MSLCSSIDCGRITTMATTADTQPAEAPATPSAAAAAIPPSLGVSLDPLPDSPPGGQYGAVFFGMHNISGTRIAVKIQRVNGLGQNEAGALHFLCTAAQPSRPPFIVRLAGQATASGWHYLAMEAAPGKEA